MCMKVIELCVIKFSLLELQTFHLLKDGNKITLKLVQNNKSTKPNWLQRGHSSPLGIF